VTQIAAWIKAQALKLGFDACGIASVPDVWDASNRLKTFVEQGLHGQMQWMEDTLERRAHPRAMWDGARSAIVLGLNYGPPSDPLEGLGHTDLGNISVYARGDDYHDVIKKKLKALGGEIARHQGCQLKVFVDTAPLMEKPLAQLAGLGWQGKHTNLVSRQLGSWLLLGVILTDMNISDEAPEADHCGSCRACLDICPTSAFIEPYRLDARKCLSYLTIEHKGAWPEAYRVAMGNRIYGCDDCLAVCPWNKFAAVGQEAKLQARASLKDLSLVELAGLDDAAFRALFAKSPIKRIGLSSFLRNVHYAMGNHLTYCAGTEFAGTGNKTDTELMVAALIANLRRDCPVIRASAVWALRQGLPTAALRDLKDKSSIIDENEDVRAEWAKVPA
jgi:epoxyqueuosine reductase